MLKWTKESLNRSCHIVDNKFPINFLFIKIRLKFQVFCVIYFYQTFIMRFLLKYLFCNC